MSKRYAKKSANSWVSVVGVILGVGVMWESIVSRLEWLPLVGMGLGVVGGILGVGLLIFLEWDKRRRLKAIQMVDLDHMTGMQFERFLVELMRVRGFEVKHMGGSGDLGTDLIINKGNDKYSVQAKRYVGWVGREAISDAVASMRYYNCNKTMVITTGEFTEAAVKLAKANECELVGRHKLTDWILEMKKGK